MVVWTTILLRIMRLGFVVVATCCLVATRTLLGCEKAEATNGSNVNIEEECIMIEERIVYLQDGAPRDISDMLHAVTNHLNTILQDVVKVELTYTGKEKCKGLGGIQV